MSAIRVARVALRARSAAVARPIQRRGYADAVSDKIKLSLALPHQVRTSHALYSSGPEPENANTAYSLFISRKMCTKDREFLSIPTNGLQCASECTGRVR